MRSVPAPSFADDITIPSANMSNIQIPYDPKMIWTQYLSVANVYPILLAGSNCVQHTPGFAWKFVAVTGCYRCASVPSSRMLAHQISPMRHTAMHR